MRWPASQIDNDTVEDVRRRAGETLGGDPRTLRLLVEGAGVQVEFGPPLCA